MSATSEHHDDGAPQGAEQTTPDPRPALSAASRRRILTAGLGAAPVLMTLASKPAFAQVAPISAAESMATCMSLGAGNPECIRGESLTTLSSRYRPQPERMALSRAASTEGAKGAEALSLTATDEMATQSWDIYSEPFLESFCGPRFSTVFGGTWGPQTGPAKWSGDERFGDVLAMDPYRDPGNLGKNLIGAYEAAMAGDFPVDSTEVVTMAHAALNGGLYDLPYPSRARWNRDNIIRYLQNVIAV